MYTDPEAFDCEIMQEENEKDALFHEMAVISAAKQALDEEREKKPEKRRFIRVARQYVPPLREIFWHGTLKEEAQEVLAALTLEQSNPTSSIDDDYGDDEGEYVELDSYTKEVVKDPDPVLQSQWERDYIATQREIQWIDEHDEIKWLDEEAYDVYRRLYTLETDPVIVEHKPILWPGDISLGARIAQEYKGDAELASKASYYDYIENDPIESVILFDDRGISSVPLQQNEEMELKIVPSDLAALRKLAKPYVDAIRQRRTEWIELAKATKRQGNWKVDFQKMINQSVEKMDFINWLKEQDTSEPQYLYMIFMSVQGEWGLPLKDLWHIKIDESDDVPEYISYGKRPGWWGTLASVHYLWGDELLSQSMDSVSRRGETTNAEILSLTEGWEEEIIETFSEDPASPATQTKAYARGVFDALGQYDADLHESGMQAWRKWRSPQAELAYRIALEKGDRRAAWRAFWNTAEVTGLRKSGVTVRTLVKGEIQQLSYPLAAWKLARHELVIPTDKKERLIDLLTSNNWGYKLLNAVRGGA